MAALRHIAWVSKRRWMGMRGLGLMFKPVPVSSRALILGVSGGARGHVSLISSVVRVLAVEQRGEDAVKMAAYGVFLLINPEGGVRA